MTDLLRALAQERDQQLAAHPDRAREIQRAFERARRALGL